MKKLLLLSSLCSMILSRAGAQVTYLVDTAITTDVGYNGAGASCIYAGGETLGWGMTRASYVWLADAFTVPEGTTWAFDTVIIYGYEIDGSTTPGYLDANLEIYNGVPGIDGSVIWGDTFTNRLAYATWTGIYRVDTSSVAGGLTQTERPISALTLYLSPAVRLTPGTYWLAWSADGTLSNSCSPIVQPGRINPPGQQARQLYKGTWYYITDEDQDVGFNKIIKASASVAASVPQVNKPALALNQNSPNPFSGTTSISFYLPQAGYAKLDVYNTIGQTTATLTDGNTDAGWHSVTFNAENLPAGIYYYRLSTDSGIESNRMLLVR